MVALALSVVSEPNALTYVFVYNVGVISSTLRSSRAFSQGGERSRKARQSLQVPNGMDPSSEKALFGENFGARDPYAGELESNFAEKVLGNWDVRFLTRLGPPDCIAAVSLTPPLARLSDGTHHQAPRCHQGIRWPDQQKMPSFYL